MKYLGLDIDYVKMEDINECYINKMILTLCHHEQNYKKNRIDQVSKNANGHFSFVDKLYREEQGQ